jgi:tryptophan halogenase
MNLTDPLRVVILGGGTAGWMAAAALVRFFPHTVDLTLIESEEIGIVGVGEATLPHLRAFLARVGLQEGEFLAETNATFKLGIDFQGFGEAGQNYIHPFGDFGTAINGVSFHHYWLADAERGEPVHLDQYSLPIIAARMGRFQPPVADGDPLDSGYGYAYQFDASRLAPLLRRLAEGQGAKRIEGRVLSAQRSGESGDVRSLTLDDGRVVEGDLFIDCSGFRALLIGEADKDNWESWSHWLPCDRAVAVPCASPAGPIDPFTRAVAMPAGWRWRIPLQHRVGNGYVFASNAVSVDEASAALLGALDGEALAEPRELRFSAGRRRASWVGNVVAIGLASGFLEPLESTSIHLIQMGITRLVELFPGRVIDPRDRERFNALIDMEYDRIRDFLILHYHATRRSGMPFWDHVRTMAVPDTLATKIELWRECGELEQYGEGLFLAPSWHAVLIGQGVLPTRVDARAAAVDPAQLHRSLAELRLEIARRAALMPDHAAYVRERCTADMA